MHSFGEKLRSERERRNTTLEEIAGPTKIRLSYLEALEHNEFDALPGRNFGKLYIRAYAEVVGFDPQPLIADYDREYVRRRREALEIASAPAETPPEEPAAVEPAEPVEVSPEEPVAVERPEPVEARAGKAVEPAASGSRSRLVTGVLLSVGLVIVVIWIYFAFLRTESPADKPAPTPASFRTMPQDTIDAPSIPPAPPPVEASEQEPATDMQAGALAPRPATDAAPNPTRLTVTEFGVGLRIVNRRLVDRGDRFEEGAVVFFSSRVIGGEPGDRIRHVWLREGKPVQRVDLDVDGPHWRTHSRKTLWGVGLWAVEVRDPEGQVLARATFTCVAADS